MYVYVFPDVQVSMNDPDRVRKDPRMVRLYDAWPQWNFFNIKDNRVIARPRGMPGINPSDHNSTLLEKFSHIVDTSDGLKCHINPDIDIRELYRGISTDTIKLKLFNKKIVNIPIAVYAPKHVFIDLNLKCTIGDYISPFGIYGKKLWDKIEEKKKNPEIIIADEEYIIFSWLALSYSYYITIEVFKKIMITNEDIIPICHAAWGMDPNPSSPGTII